MLNDRQKPWHTEPMNTWPVSNGISSKCWLSAEDSRRPVTDWVMISRQTPASIAVLTHWDSVPEPDSAKLGALILLISGQIMKITKKAQTTITVQECRERMYTAAPTRYSDWASTINLNTEQTREPSVCNSATDGFFIPLFQYSDKITHLAKIISSKSHLSHFFLNFALHLRK